MVSPPFLYPKKKKMFGFLAFPKDEEVAFFTKTGAPTFGAAMLAALVNHPIATLFAALVGLWCGFKIRAKVRLEFEPVVPSIIHPFPVKWPMFAFDLWTFGIAGFFALLHFAG